MTLKLQTDLHNGSSRIITSIHSTIMESWLCCNHDSKSLCGFQKLSSIFCHLICPRKDQHSLWTMSLPARVGHWLMQPLYITRQHLKSLLWTRTHNKSATVINNYLLYLTMFPYITQQDFIHLYKTIAFKKCVCKTKLILYRHSDLNTQVVHSDRGCLLVSLNSPPSSTYIYIQWMKAIFFLGIKQWSILCAKVPKVKQWIRFDRHACIQPWCSSENKPSSPFNQIWGPVEKTVPHSPVFNMLQ